MFCGFEHSEPEHFSGAEQLPSVADLGDRLYEGSSISVDEAVTALLTFAQTAKLSGQTLGRLLSLINLLLPKPNKLPTTVFQFFSTLQCEDSEVNIHYFCSNCYKERSSAKDYCDNCDCKTVDFFIHLPVGPQLKKMLNRDKFVDLLEYENFGRK